MIEMGILDPAKVTRTAIQAAGSVAGMMITTEAMVTDIPKDEAPMPAMPDTQCQAWLALKISPPCTQGLHGWH